MWGIGMSVVSDTYMKKEKYPCSFLPSKNGIILIFFYVTFTFFKKKNYMWAEVKGLQHGTSASMWPRMTVWSVLNLSIFNHLPLISKKFGK